MFEDILEKFGIWIVLHGVKIGLILVGAFLATKILQGVLKKILRNFIKKTFNLGKLRNLKLEEERLKTLEKVLGSVLKVVIWLIALVTLLPEFGINIGPLLTGIGIGGLALGLGARTLIQDYISGIFILLEDQYRVGEEVEILGTKGKIRDFNLRRTVIQDENGTLHYIPNSQIKKASNFSRK